MPLLDHFRPPLYPRRHWESLHASWSNNIMARLNERILPEGYYAETQIHIGGRVEVDVAALEESTGSTGFFFLQQVVLLDGITPAQGWGELAQDGS